MRVNHLKLLPVATSLRCEGPIRKPPLHRKESSASHCCTARTHHRAHVSPYMSTHTHLLTTRTLVRMNHLKLLPGPTSTTKLSCTTAPRRFISKSPLHGCTARTHLQATVAPRGHICEPYPHATTTTRDSARPQFKKNTSAHESSQAASRLRENHQARLQHWTHPQAAASLAQAN
jgi:hypothetical protein